MPYLHQHMLTPQPARLGAEIAGNELWHRLPSPVGKTIVAVYKFRDQTGQYRLLETGASFSTVVTQGATSILLRALEESQWFESIERENIGNLLNERKIIRSAQSEYAAQTGKQPAPLASMLFASIILEGGIISYDSNIITGGGGLRYFGAGASGQYRQDRVTVYLRAISTNTGRIMKTVYTSKTILSQQLSAGVFQFVDFKRLLETETGITYNEPSEMAVKEAIEKSVQALILEGIKDKFWAPRDTAERHGPAMLAYLREKTENLSIDALGRVEQPRRAGIGLGISGGLQRYQGDYSTPLNRGVAELTLRWQASPAGSVFLNAGRGQLAAGPGGSYFSQVFDYAEAGGLIRLLPSDRFTPFLLVGGGATLREGRAGLYRVLPHAVTGIGAEYLLGNRLGLSLTLDNHYYFSDQLDLLAQGSYNDYYWGARLGAVFYVGRLSRSRAASPP
ncbi:curli production assembly/transport component CsgG [Hymenobacter sp. BRD67]|nr:curli production assembly/transport component CsgG [Hymenobacter sp. BRD67]